MRSIVCMNEATTPTNEPAKRMLHGKETGCFARIYAAYHDNVTGQVNIYVTSRLLLHLYVQGSTMKNIVIIVVVAAVVMGGWGLYQIVGSSQKQTENVSSQDMPSVKSSDTLDLSNTGLTKVGSDIYNQTGLKALILSYNELTSLPSEMGRLTSLEVLKLDHNRLEGSLIAEIRKMPLVTLDASYNQMTGVPAEIGQIRTLQTLDLSHNDITALPNEIMNITQLRQLVLTGNPLPEATIANLKSKLPDTEIVW